MERTDFLEHIPVELRSDRLGRKTGWPSGPKPVKLSRHSTAQPSEASLTHVTHSKMLETRRRRERAKKDFAGTAKRAKNLAKRNAKKARAGAAKPA